MYMYDAENIRWLASDTDYPHLHAMRQLMHSAHSDTYMK